MIDKGYSASIYIVIDESVELTEKQSVDLPLPRTRISQIPIEPSREAELSRPDAHVSLQHSA